MTGTASSAMGGEDAQVAAPEEPPRPTPPGRHGGRGVLALVGVATSALFAALATVASARLWQSVAPGVTCTVLAGVLLAVVATVRSAGRRAQEDGPDVTFLVAASLLLVASRLPWVLWSPTLPASDFAFYDELAQQVATGAPVTVRWPHMGVIMSWGYPLALAGPYALLGAELPVARGFHLLLALVALLALYALARRVAGRAAARVACVLFVLWPTQLLFSGVLASEHLGMPLLLVALWCGVRAGDADALRKALAWCGASGVLLGLASGARSALVAALLATALALLLDPRWVWRERLAQAGVVVLAFAATTSVFFAAIEGVVGFRPASGDGWSLLAGANVAEGGRWSRSDMERFTAHPDVASANRFARAAALERVLADPLGYAALVPEKVAYMWTDGTHALYWSTLALRDDGVARRLERSALRVHALLQAFHATVLLLATAGLALGAVRAAAGGVPLLMLVLLASTLVHGALETQSRYNFPLVPLLFVFAGSAATLLGGVRRTAQPPLRATTSQQPIA